ncbi:MAG: hypothetical protein HC836_21330 [Richelia sp. RM2_1_2]|nr:hypothetical protein [Richelia sp. SM2_1_7]NJM20675.1 hypothetical protein [Richelia sp. SM1_7_0]NJN09158.1 hypothetical protein [Richelia sp. RM1_1_1]NJO28699.1 hypothetical protein [Richelia sp. SL_2_1]NJO60710.1 hypothetical protein [Richelia sp. RM2_1_2]
MKSNTISSPEQKQDIASFTRNISLVFASGCLGGLLNSITVWLFGFVGITSLFNVQIAPTLTAFWLYPRIVWGGIWGFLFLIPFYRNKYVLKGILLSLIPTLVQLLMVFPLQAKKGIFGIELGSLTPIFVIIFNFVWGITAAFWLKISK